MYQIFRNHYLTETPGARSVDAKTLNQICQGLNAGEMAGNTGAWWHVRKI